MITIVDNYTVNTELTGTQEKTFTLDIDILGSFQRKYYLNSQFKPHDKGNRNKGIRNSKSSLVT